MVWSVAPNWVPRETTMPSNNEPTKMPEPRFPKLSEEQKDRLLRELKRIEPKVRKKIPKDVN